LEELTKMINIMEANLTNQESWKITWSKNINQV
jgi:hypothetical protein